MDRKEAAERIQEVMAIIKTQHMCKDIDGECTEEDRKAYIQRFEACKLAIAALQEPERKKGQWIKYGYKWKCSECDGKINIDGTPEENGLYYCPNCGADMRGEEE